PKNAALVDRVFREEAGEKAGARVGEAQFSVDSGPETIPAPEAMLPSVPTKRSPEQSTPAGLPMVTPVKRIRCPHCQNPIQLSDDRPREGLCPGCGSSFRGREARQTTPTGTKRPLGKFQLLERVGLGAFGAVWRARDTELDRIVALKIPHASLLTSAA